MSFTPLCCFRLHLRKCLSHFLKMNRKRRKIHLSLAFTCYVDPRTDLDRPSLATTSLHPMVATRSSVLAHLHCQQGNCCTKPGSSENFDCWKSPTSQEVVVLQKHEVTCPQEVVLLQKHEVSPSQPVAHFQLLRSPRVDRVQLGLITLSKPSQPVNLTPTSCTNFSTEKHIIELAEKICF